MNFHKNQPKSLEYHISFFKTIQLMFTYIIIYPLKNKTDHISEKYISFHRNEVKQKLIFSRFKFGFGAGSGSGSISKLNESAALVRNYVKTR